MTGARIACFVPPASFVLCLLFFNMLFFLKKLAKTSVGTENIPLIRHLGFAERERETFAELIFHLSFLIEWVNCSIPKV